MSDEWEFAAPSNLKSAEIRNPVSVPETIRVQIAELEMENLRLQRLVAELLLKNQRLRKIQE